MTVVKAAAVQLSPVLYSRDGRVEKVVREIAELGRQDVQFATFPETAQIMADTGAPIGPISGVHRDRVPSRRIAG